jgi:chromosome partitioning protein
MLTFALLNRKGGVGKTSLTIHLAGAYAAKGKRVLLVDLDPQASLTQGLLGPQETERLPRNATVAALFDDADCDPAGLPVPTAIAGVSIVPGSEGLDEINIPRPALAGPYQTAIRELLDSLSTPHSRVPTPDLVLIDCPPTLYLCSWCALLAADRVVVPVMPDQYGTHSIVAMHDLVAQARERNGKLEVLGYVLNKLQPRLALHQLYEGELREMYAGHVLINAVPLLADYGLAAATGQPVETWKPKSKAAQFVRAVADELWLRAEVQQAAINPQPAIGEVA